MIDKRKEAETYERRRRFARQEEENVRLKSFANTGALLTKDGKIIRPHVSDADFNSDRACTDYLKQRLHEIGAQKLAEEGGTSLEHLLDRLFEMAGEENCVELVQVLFTERTL